MSDNVDKENENGSDLTYPIDEKVAYLSKFMQKVFNGWTERNVTFSLKNPESNDGQEFEMGQGNENTLASPSLLLPLFFYSSIETYNETVKKQLPIHFYSEENSLLLWVPSIYEDKNNSLFIWTHLLDHSVEKLIKEQYPDYKKKLRKNEKIKVGLDVLYNK